MRELKLVYVKRSGETYDKHFDYEFFFSNTPEVVWGEDWNEQCPSACGDTTPDESTYHEVYEIRCDIPLFCAQDNSCLSLQDMTDGIISCAWEDLTDYDSYPEPYRLVFAFGEDIVDVFDKLKGRNVEIGLKYEEQQKEQGT